MDKVINLHQLKLAVQSLVNKIRGVENKVDADRSRIVTLEGAVSQIDNADWGENDSSSISYIENRTHYREILEDYTFFENVAIEITASSGNRTYSWATGMETFGEDGWNRIINGIIEGGTYTCIYDGNEYLEKSYIATSSLDSRYNAIGNPTLLSSSYAVVDGVGDENAPFAILVTSSSVSFRTNTGAANHTLSIYGEYDQYTPIDTKYLPGALIKRGTGSNSEIFNNSTVSEASGNYSHAEGSSTIASGSTSHAEGSSTTASGYCSHAEGLLVTASGNYSHAEGSSTIASGSTSHAEGGSTTASGTASHAEGDHSIASGAQSHAEGVSTWTSAAVLEKLEGENHYSLSGVTSRVSNSAMVIGGVIRKINRYYYITDATIVNEKITEITTNVAVLDDDLSPTKVEFYLPTKAVGQGSHAEGNRATAYGNYSHSEGAVTFANGLGAHAEGLFTYANGDGAHSQGKYPLIDSEGTYAHVVGNGTSVDARSNAHTIDWNGNGWYAGKLTVGTAPTADMDVATKKYVDDATAGISPNLSGLADTSISNPENGNVLIYDGTSSKWVNATPTNVTYSLSLSGNTITLTGSDGSTSSIVLPVYAGAVIEDGNEVAY